MRALHVSDCMQTFWETAKTRITKIELVILLKVESKCGAECY